MIESLSIDVIRTDGGTQIRGTINDQKVVEYAEAYEAGSNFPPCDAFYDGQEYWLADGFHRVRAQKKIDRKTVSTTIHAGTKRDALLFAIGADNKLGLARSNADKRRAVGLLLADPEWSKWSDRVIAEKCGVGYKLVADVRDQLRETRSSTPPAKRKGKDGKLRVDRENLPVTLDEVPDESTDAEPQRRSTYEKDFHEAVARLGDEGLSAQEIAKQLDAPVQKVYRSRGIHRAPKSPLEKLRAAAEDSSIFWNNCADNWKEDWSAATNEQKKALTGALKKLIESSNNFIRRLNKDAARGK